MVFFFNFRLRRAPYRGSPWAASSLRRPAARGLQGKKNCESLTGGWINFVSVYSYICFVLLFVYILLSFCYVMCMHSFIFHDILYLYGLTRCNSHTYLSLFLSIYISIHVSVGHINMFMKLIKILWFWGVLLIFFSPAAGPLPGVALRSGEQPPAARCAGA